MFRSKQPVKKPIDSSCCPKDMLGSLMKPAQPLKPLRKK